MISAFGPNAERFAHAIGDLNVVIAETETIAAAYPAAVQRRETGEPFYCMLLADDSRIAFGYRYAEQILAGSPNYDHRRLIADQLVLGSLPINGDRVDVAWRLDPLIELVAVEFLALGDAVLVRSFSEVPRLRRWFANASPPRPLPPVERILAAAQVPIVARARPERPSVVVWAPYRPALECTLHLHGLREFHGELTCVSAGGVRPSETQATFLAPGDPAVADVLSRASAIVCIDPSDPSDAVAFARLGYGIVAPLTSGAHEFAADVVTWDAIDSRRLFTTVAVAVTRPASVRSEPARPLRAPERPARPEFVDPTALPLVTIITPTYNRRDNLKAMLSCLAAQTYPNIEAVVVNDGGVALDDIVAEFPFARLFNQPVNAGALRAVEAGRLVARGEYIGLLPDDDWLYPDHVERLVTAMLRSGAKVAHSAALLRFLERNEVGGLETTGFNNRTFSQTLAPSEALVIASLAGHQMLVHRSAYEAVGSYLLDSDISDNEIHMRLTQRYFYAFVDHVTSEFRDHNGGQGRQCDFPAAMREVYEKYHPVANRPVITRVREATLEKVGSRPAGIPPFPATLRLLKVSGPT